MKFQFRSVFRLLLAAAPLALCGQASADWVQSPDPLVVGPAPKNMTTQVANPPVFTWARHTSNPPSYVVEIKTGNTVYKTFTVTRNWLFPSTAFAAGTYTWRVRPSNNATAWSDPRTFIINSATRNFIVPDDATLRARVAAKAHPRSIQSNIPVYANWSAALIAERGTALTKLRTEVEWYFTRLTLPYDANWPLTGTSAVTPENVAQNAAVRASIFANGRQLEASALLYRLTGERKYFTEAMIRADALANLNVYGPTSYQNQDQGTRVIALSLARTIDFLGADLDATRRTRFRSIIDQRTTAMYNDLAGSNGRMDQYPFDSHGNTNLWYLALIAALTVGDIPNASTWFDFAFRAAVASTSVWSGPEGGFGNGTAYAEYTTQILQSIWQSVGTITDVNMFDKPWSQGFLKYLMHFVPPGATSHVFGDSHEEKPSLKVPKIFASRYATREAAWYYRSIVEDMDVLATLQAPYPLPVSSVASPAPPPNSAIFSSIGWAAMHSNIADSNRTSVYFKSSPYGSYNHSHADQNSIVVMKGGKPLLSEAGYLDYFGSPLQNSWYRQTKAHNAITFNGGIGQATEGYTPIGYNKMMLGGNIVAFSATAAVDYVEGDATPAYDGALTKAVRKLWYLRNQDALVVLDTLTSPTALKFEWNLHSQSRMTFEADTKTVSFTDAAGTQRVCVRPILSAPDFAPERRTGATPKAGAVEDHAAFVSSAARTSQEYLILVDIGCKRPGLGLKYGTTSRTLTVGNQSITLPR